MFFQSLQIALNVKCFTLCVRARLCRLCTIATTHVLCHAYCHPLCTYCVRCATPGDMGCNCWPPPSGAATARNCRDFDHRVCGRRQQQALICIRRTPSQRAHTIPTGYVYPPTMHTAPARCTSVAARTSMSAYDSPRLQGVIRSQDSTTTARGCRARQQWPRAVLRGLRKPHQRLQANAASVLGCGGCGGLHVASRDREAWHRS